MTTLDIARPPYLDTVRSAPYHSDLASTASASAVSVYSDASSCTYPSDTPASSAPSSQSDFASPYHFRDSSAITVAKSQPRQSIINTSAPQIPPHLRQNPRRSSQASTSQHAGPPSLVRQADRKLNFVDNLVDSSTQIVEAIWPTSSVACRTASGDSGVLPLRTFIQETLRRSRTSFSTLQVALYYLVLIKPHIPKHDFTMEQSNDCHATRALQCGRRMFLAALILASKYLQDRNYSARAWSKISGLHSQEINQNEMAFLLAVNWKLHITDDTYNRWTDSIMSHTPSQPPAPGGAAQVVFEQQCATFKRIILHINPALDNLEQILPTTPRKMSVRRALNTSPRSALAAAQGQVDAFGSWRNDVTPTPSSRHTPSIMEPSPTSVYNTAGRHAPALGLLPTPRLTPQQPRGLGTPAESAMSNRLGKCASMSFALAQAGNAQASTCIDRWPTSSVPSPQSYAPSRRSSLARTASTSSSPESMVSDTSRTSRSSSISSASSIAPAPHVKLDVQARCRSAQLCGERSGLRLLQTSNRADYGLEGMTASPDSYVGPTGKELDELSLSTPTACSMDEATNDAAKTLQEMRRASSRLNPACALMSQAVRNGRKRTRSSSLDDSLQDSVREMLWKPSGDLNARQSNETLRTLRRGPQARQRASVPCLSRALSKRTCCSAEIAHQSHQSFLANLHPALGGTGGPGMWNSILQ